LTKYLLKLVFRAEEHVHVGSSEGEGEVLLEVMKVNGKPIIPSTTLKGALRALAESIMKGVDGDALPQEVSKAVKAHREDERGLRHIDTPVSEENEDAEREVAEKCPIDRLFGSLAFASSLKLSDALPRDEVMLGHLTSVGIDRCSLTAKKGVLFTLEVVERGAEFVSYAVLDLDSPELKADKYHLKLLMALLNHIKERGLKVGSRKSVGLGLIKLVEFTALKFECMDDLIYPQRKQMDFASFMKDLTSRIIE